MLKGLQVAFNAPVDRGLLRELQACGVQMCRMDCQHVDGDPLTAMVEDVLQCGMKPLVVLDNERQIACLPNGPDVYAELLNEPDLAGMPVAEYQRRFVTFCEAAQLRDIVPCGPVVSNLNGRGLGYLTALRPLPQGSVCSIHRYPHGISWQTPQPGFSTRLEEQIAFTTAIGLNHPRYGVSEFGYNSHDQSDEQATENIRSEFTWWEMHGALYAVLYQLNDGVENTVMNRYGVRRADGSFKPQMAAFQ